MQVKRVGISAFVIVMLAASLALASGQKDDRQAAKANPAALVNLNTATLSQLDSRTGLRGATKC